MDIYDFICFARKSKNSEFISYDQYVSDRLLVLLLISGVVSTKTRVRWRNTLQLVSEQRLPLHLLAAYFKRKIPTREVSGLL